MRVVEPTSFKGLRRKRVKPKIAMFWAVLLLIAGWSGWWFWQQDNSSVSTKPTKILGILPITKTIKPEKTSETSIVPKPVRTFTPEQFKQLYRSVAYPNTQSITEPIPITGNKIADNRIRSLADASGYRQTSIPVQSIVKIPGFNEGDNLLQPLAFNGWVELKAAADREHIPIIIISAYRSPEYQRTLFLSRLLSESVTPESIAAGLSDVNVKITLHMTAVPGFSRHHTGYTVDLWCRDGSDNFASSKCFKWLNGNNYQNAKEHGWIPSYPAGANEQGPEPEPWEYVWIGRDTLT